MLMCFWRGRSMPAIRAIVLNLSWLLALSFWLLAKAKSPRPKAVSALALFVFRVDADHPHHTLAVDDLALVTNFLYRCSYFHKPAFSCPLSFFTAFSKNLFVAIHNPAAIQIVRRKLDRDLIARKDTNEILAHLAGHMRQHLVLVLQFHAEHGVRQRF